jgi:hypothetical protein
MRHLTLFSGSLTPIRERAFGRFLAKRGTQRVLEEAEKAPTNRERIARWRNLYSTIPLEHTLSPTRKTA